MSAYIRLPYINPIRFFKAGEGNWSVNEVPPFEERKGYLLKLCPADHVYFQIQSKKSTFDNSIIYLTDQYGTIVTSFPIYQIDTAVLYPDYYQYAAVFDVPNVADGVYYLKMLLENDASILLPFWSEPIYIKQQHPGTIVLSWDNNRLNDFDVIFSSDPPAKFYFRIEGGMKSDGFTPAGKFTMFQDLNYEPVMLDATPYNTFKFTFGPGNGAPNWIGDLINRALCCQRFWIDGVQYTRNEGAKLEPVRDQGYPLAGWVIELLKAENPQSSEWGDSETGQLSLTWDNSSITFDNSLLTFDQTQY